MFASMDLFSTFYARNFIQTDYKDKSNDLLSFKYHWTGIYRLLMTPSTMICVNTNQPLTKHDDVIKLKHFPRYWPSVRGMYRSPHKGQWRGTLMFSLICAWTNDWANSRDAGDLRRHRAHYDVIVMGIDGCTTSQPLSTAVYSTITRSRHTLKSECCHFHEISNIDNPRSFHFDIFRERKSCQGDCPGRLCFNVSSDEKGSNSRDLSVSVFRRSRWHKCHPPFQHMLCNHDNWDAGYHWVDMVCADDLAPILCQYICSYQPDIGVVYMSINHIAWFANALRTSFVHIYEPRFNIRQDIVL